MPLSILIAGLDDHRDRLVAQFDADGHLVYGAETVTHAHAIVCMRRIDVLVLGLLESREAAFALLGDLRRGEVGTVDDEMPVVTLGATDEVSVLRAYATGTDNHLPAGAGYLIVRAVVEAVARRSQRDADRHRVRVDGIEIDGSTRRVRVHGEDVDLTNKEFELLRTLANEPARVFTKDELLRDVWGYRAAARTRTLDSHAVRLRRKLAAHGQRAVVNVWGVGWKLMS